MFWIRTLMLCEALLLAHCYIRQLKKPCNADQEDEDSYYDEEEKDPSEHPAPPEMGHSYIAKYEMSSFYGTHSAWVEEYFDYEGKRAKISSTVLGMEFVDYYDYDRRTVTSYRLQRPESSGWSSKIENTCETVDMADFKATFPALSYPVPNITNTTSNRAFKYGRMYNYTFKEEEVGVETRNINYDAFTACINENYLNYSLRSDVYWGKELKSSYPSGEERIPLFIEMRGPHINDRSKEMYIMKYVSWYQKDPKFTPEMFEIPKGLYCEYLAKPARLPDIPPSFSYSFEEIEFQLDNSGFLKGDFRSTSSKQVWYDLDLGLARLDMRPTANDLEALGLETKDGPFESISVLSDFKLGVTYVSNMATSVCLQKRDNTTFFWRHENDTLKSPEEHFDINANLQYKGKSTLMGIDVEVWTEFTNNTNDGKITKRDLYFSLPGKTKDKYTDKHTSSLLQESFYEENDTKTKSVRKFVDQNVRVKNYFEFTPNAPESHVFDGHACIPGESSASYYVDFKPINSCVLDAGNMSTFLRAFRANVSDTVGLNTTLSLQGLYFAPSKPEDLSVGFTFNAGIPGEETDETSFKEKAESSKLKINVSFRLSAKSETDVCKWESNGFRQISADGYQLSAVSGLEKCSNGGVTFTA